MNAEPSPNIPRPPKREDYESVVKGLRPLVHGEELVLRTSLLLMRDRAMATKNRACEPAWLLLDIVERQASDVAMNHKVGIDDLKEIRRLCFQLVAAARDFDMLYQPPLPLDEGEAK